MSATVHPPSNQQKFWPLKKFALGKSTHTNSAQHKASLGPGDKKTKKGSTSNKPPNSAAATPVTATPAATAEATTKTTLVTLSKQKDTSSISLQRRRGEKGQGTPVNDTSSIVSKKQDQGNVTLGASVMTTQRSRQRASSPQSNPAQLSGKDPTRQQQQTHALSRRSSLKPTKKDVAYHQQQQQQQQQQQLSTEDIQINTDTISTLSAPKPSLSPVTTMPTIAAPSIESIATIVNTSPRPLTRSNTFSAPPPPPQPSNPPAIPALSDTNEPAMMPMTAKSQQKLLRPTSCTSLRQMALHQTVYPPSPKSRHQNSQEYYYQHQHPYPQHIIKRSSTFNHMSPPGSSYRRSSESTLEDNLMTPNNEDDYDISGQNYHIEDHYYYEDDEQTMYSNNFLMVDPNKPPPPPSPPTRRILKRPVSMICQRPPDSLYLTDPSAHRHLPHQQHPQQNQYLHHHHHHHPGVVTVGGAGDLCIPSTPGNYHQDGYYFASHDNSATSPVPTSPGSTDSGSGHDLHRQQYHQPIYVFPDPSSFNEKHPKRNSLHQVHHNQAQHPQTQQYQPQQSPPQQKQQQQQQQQKSHGGSSSHQRHHLSLDLLKQELESERAVVCALQRQKEAYNKDISYLCQNVDKLTKDGKEWKAKYEQEKAEKEKHQDDLLAAMNKFSEATEQIKQLSSEKQRLKMELDSVNNQLIMEKSKKTPTQPPATIAAAVASFTEYHPTPPSKCPEQHQQIKYIQNTMLQLLQLDIFGNTPIPRSDEVLNGTLKDRKSDQDKDHPPMTRTSSILSSGNQSPRKATPRSRSSSSKPHENATTKPDDTMPTTSSAEKPDSPSHQHSFIDTGPRNTLSSTNLDAQLQSLLQEKELLQAEYSKIPVSGGNAICRRRREDLESRLDEVDSKMRKIRLRIKRRHKKGHF